MREEVREQGGNIGKEGNVASPPLQGSNLFLLTESVRERKSHSLLIWFFFSNNRFSQ